MSDFAKKFAKSSGKNEATKKVTPIRFDSAPTRVRFDSAPTRIRLDEKPKPQPSKSITKQPVKMSNEAKTQNVVKVKTGGLSESKNESDQTKSQSEKNSSKKIIESTKTVDKVEPKELIVKSSKINKLGTDTKQKDQIEVKVKEKRKMEEEIKEKVKTEKEIKEKVKTEKEIKEKVKTEEEIKEKVKTKDETKEKEKVNEEIKQKSKLMEPEVKEKSKMETTDEKVKRKSEELPNKSVEIEKMIVPDVKLVESEKIDENIEKHSKNMENEPEEKENSGRDDDEDDLKNDGQDSNDSTKKESNLMATIKKLEDRIKRTTSVELEEEHESEVDETDEISEEDAKDKGSVDKLDEVGITDPKSTSSSTDSQDDEELEADNESEKSDGKSLENVDENKLMEVDNIETEKEAVDEKNDNLIEMATEDSNLTFEISDVRTVQEMDENSEDKSVEMDPVDEIKSLLDNMLNEVGNKEKKSEEENEVQILSQTIVKTVIKIEKDDVVVEDSLKKSKPILKPRMLERLCIECDRVKTCKYQVHMPDTTRFLCDDNCFKSYRNRTKLTTNLAPTFENRPITRSLTQPKDFCSVCRKEIKNGIGFLSGVGENKPLCSEECMRKYYTVNAPKRGCSQCGTAIQGRNKCLTWETMEFCNEDCLGKYQSFLGSHCAKCCNAVQRTSLGKYCVRFGSDIKQFCSNLCLEDFKRTLRVCSFCQKDISSSRDGLVARIGDKGVCKDFCSKVCVEKFETMNKKKSQPNVQMCSVCNKIVPIKVQVSFEGKTHCLCSDPCIAAFRYANKISTSICDSCHKFFHVDVSQPYTIQFEGLSKRFCAKSCMNVFVLSHRKIVPCTWCKVKKYNFDMIERVDSNNRVQLFCSLNCLSLFRVSLNATSAKSIRCDHCHNSQPAQYHLTMSDASIRNFCSYQCVMTFQGQFTNVAPVTSKIVATSITTAPTVTTTIPQTAKPSTNGTPVISSVRSLAPLQQSQPLIVVPSRAQTATSIIATDTATKPTPVATTSVSTSTQATTQVLIKPPNPKQMKNKSLMCRPFMQTKGVSCKPHPCHKNIQTEPEEEKVVTKPCIIPVPIPIYVPVPMHMYVRPVPVPIPFPVPVPVPIFIPTSKNTVEEISKQIKEIQDKIPNNPFEAELLMMAEMVANNNKSATNKSGSNTSNTSTPAGTSNGEQGQISSDAEQSEQFGIENQISDGMHATNAFSDDMLQMALRMATEMDEPAMDVESALEPSGHQSSHDTAFNSIEENNSDILSPRELRARNRGQKRSGSHRGRGRKKSRTDENSLQMTPGGMVTPADSNSILKYTYGVNAWKHWVLEKNTQLEKASQNNRKLKLFKTDLLQLTADELNYSLCLFVKEVRKPNREEYASDSIFYLCLGIQQYLFENGRIDNIFSDAYYEKFTECLNEVLQKGETIGNLDGVISSRIEEEMLWEAKQLGAHSPHVLLNTLMYFNAKFFLLRTVEDHMRLSFSHILKQWKKSGSLSPARAANQSTPGRSVLLRYCPPTHNKGEVGRKRKDDQTALEQLENLDNPLRCPVKLYEFYLSKCPESIRNRSDVFYLNPERSCVPDSPVWYSTMPLGKDAISKMLQRIKNVREVCEVF